VTGSCCAESLWIKQTLKDSGLNFNYITIKCDNTNVISLSKNPI